MKTVYFLLACLSPCMSIAQAGSPDPEFDGDGVLITPILSDAHAFSNDVLVQQDGRILVTGSSNNYENHEFGVLLRFLPDGNPDPEFNGSGKAYIHYPDHHCSGNASVQQQDGKIVTVFRLFNEVTGNTMALMRFHPDGSPDTEFGTDGIQLLNLGLFYQAPNAMIMQPDGKFLIGGYAGHFNAEYDEFFVARCLPDGSWDTSFDGDGFVITTVGETYTDVKSILIQPDGKIIAAGYGMLNGKDSFVAARYMPNGPLDPTFHEDGIALISISDRDCRAAGAALQPDGKIVLGGYIESEDGKYDFGAIRLTSDGNLDDSFHGDGIAEISLTNFGDAASAIALQPDGKILLAGCTHTTAEGGSDMALVRLNANGAPDFTFDNDGIVDFQASSSSDFINDITLQSDGKIVAAGYARIGYYNQITVARFLSGITVSTTDPIPAIHSLMLYPNPVTDHFRIAYQLDREETITMQLADLQGRIIKTLLPPTSRGEGSHIEIIKINQSLTTGMYIVRIKTSSGEQSIKILVE